MKEEENVVAYMLVSWGRPKFNCYFIATKPLDHRSFWKQVAKKPGVSPKVIMGECKLRCPHYAGWRTWYYSQSLTYDPNTYTKLRANAHYNNKTRGGVPRTPQYALHNIQDGCCTLWLSDGGRGSSNSMVLSSKSGSFSEAMELGHNRHLTLTCGSLPSHL